MWKFLPNPTQLLADLRAIRPGEVALSVKNWAVTSGVWYLTSVTGHVVVLSAVLLLLGKATQKAEQSEAPAFDSAINTEITPPELDHFEVGDTPLDPAELNTDTLSLVDAPGIEAEQALPDASRRAGRRRRRSRRAGRRHRRAGWILRQCVGTRPAGAGVGRRRRGIGARSG